MKAKPMTTDDIVTVRCYQCRQWLVRPDSVPPGVPTLYPAVAGRIDGRCYCEPCLRPDAGSRTKADDRD